MKNVGANVVMNVVMNVVTNVVTASLQYYYYAPINVSPAGRRRGKGAGFDEKVYPVSGEFDDQYSPRGRGI